MEQLGNNRQQAVISAQNGDRDRLQASEGEAGFLSLAFDSDWS